jgi:acyl carrier protein
MESTVKYIDVDNLVLDDQNPRLPTHLRGAAEEKLIEYMLLEASTIELMQAIGENDFFAGELLLVVPTDSDKFRVVEGNRRTTAVKLLRNPALAKVQTKKVQQVYAGANHHPDNIPCLVFSQEEDIHKYLGYRHITGVEPWNLRQKARYLSSLKNNLFTTENIDTASRELAKMIGSRRDYVKRLLVGFDIYEKIEDQGFFKIRGLDEATFYFGYIADSLRWANIVDFLGVDFDQDIPLEELVVENLKKWTKWLFEKYGDGGKTKLKGKSGDLSKLNAILANPIALKAFDEENDSLDKAYELTEDINQLIETSIGKALNELELADGLTHKASSFYTSLEDDLRQLIKLARKIKQAKDDFINNEFEEDEFGG